MICIENVWYEETYLGSYRQADVDNCGKGSEILQNKGGFMPMLINEEIDGQHLKDYLSEEKWTNSIFKEYKSYIILTYENEQDHIITRVLFQEIPWKSMYWFGYKLDLSQ